MAFCRNCGKEIQETAVFCPFCGSSQQTTQQINEFESATNVRSQAVYDGQSNNGTTSPATPDTGNFGWGLLGFCIPIVGLVLWIVWNASHPRNAKAAGTGALVSVILGILFYVLIMVVGVGAAFSL